MNKHLLYVLPVLLLAACGETPERYRDIHHLELPPELPIEHTHQQAAVGADDLKPKVSALAGLMVFEEIAGKPVLTLKTRRERAWEMVATALRIDDINVIDKNRDLSLFQVRYDPDIDGKQVGFVSSLFNNDYPEAEYTIKLKEEIAGVLVEVAPNQANELDSSEDGSAELVRLLHRTINDKIINRDDSKSREN